MKWLNIELKVFHTPEYIGSDPVHRATFWNLLGYCAEQENGGWIRGCADWKSRMWEQSAGVTEEEVKSPSMLWKWVANSIQVWHYPVETEAEVRAKREGGRVGGKASGKARKKAALEAAREPQIEAPGEAYLEAELEAHLERKEKKGNEKEGKGRGNTPAQVEIPTPTPPDNRPPVPDLPTEAQAIEQAASVGALPDFARYVYADWVSRGGKDGSGQPVEWRRYVAKRWAREQVEWQAGTHKGTRKTGTNGSSTAKLPTVFELKTRRDAILEEMTNLENRGYRDSWGVHLKPEDQPKMRALKTERAKIQAQLTGVQS